MSSISPWSALDTKHLQLLLSAQGLSTAGSRGILEQRLDQELQRRTSGIWVHEKLPSLPVSRIGCSIVEYDSSFYIFGGFDTMGIPSNSLYVCKPGSKSWQRVQVSGTTPAPALNDHIAVVFESELWVFGSLRGPRLGDREVCVAVYNFSSNRWRTVERRGVIHRSIEHFAVFDHCLREEMLLFATEEGIFGFHFRHEVWMEVHHSPALNAFWGNYHITTDDSDLVIFGWSDAGGGGFRQDHPGQCLDLKMYKLNVDTGSWCRLLFNGTPPTARARCKAVRVDNKWVLHGGSTEYASGASLSETYVYNLTTKMWTKLDIDGGTGVPRAHYGAISFQDRAIVYAGGRKDWLGMNQALSTPCLEVDVLRLLTTADLDGRKEPDSLLVFADNSRCTMISSLRRQLFDNPHLSDVVIHVQDKSFLAHKLVLAEASPVFAKMWSLHMSEHRSSDIELKTFDDGTVEVLLLYMYGCLDESRLRDKAIEAFKAADLYEVHGLKAECLKYMISDLSSNNVLEYWIFGDFYSCGELMTACLDCAATHSNTFFESLAFLELSHRRPIACYRFLRSLLREMSNERFFDPRHRTSWSEDLILDTERLELLDMSSTVVMKIEDLLTEIKRLRNKNNSVELV